MAGNRVARTLTALTILVALAACNPPKMEYVPPATGVSQFAMMRINTAADFDAFRSEYPGLCADVQGGRALAACFISVLVSANVPDPAQAQTHWEHQAIIRLDEKAFCSARGFAPLDWERTGFQVRASIYIVPPPDEALDHRLDLVTVGSGTLNSWKTGVISECATLL